MIVCSANQISKMYAGTWIFQELTIHLHEKERIGLIGTNGSGKTTLLKCIAGVEMIDQGTISYKKDIKIGILDQIPEVNHSFTVEGVLKQSFQEVFEIEQQLNRVTEKMGDPSEQHQLEKLYNQYALLQGMFEDMNGYAVESKINGVLQGLGLEELKTHTFQSLSGGEQTKVGLASILLEEPDLLLLDEPTNHLDMEALSWLEEYLNNYSGTVLVISHDRYFLDRITTKIVKIESGAIEQYKGNYSNFIKEKEKRLLLEFQAFQDQQKKIKKMKEAIKRLREWAIRADNAAMHKRARNMERALERMNKIDRPQLERKTATLEFKNTKRSGKDVIIVEDVWKSIEDRILFSEINLLLQYQERAAILGKNGVGKSTLLRIILGELPPDYGTIKLGASVKVGYLSQQGLVGYDDWTVIDAYRDIAEIEEGEARHRLSKFLFYGREVFQNVGDLSGGERTRLRLAQLMSQNVNLLILDEPTNHLDIDSREVLEEALEDFKGTMLLVSHDRYFLNKLTNRIFWIEDEGLNSYLGNYETVKEKRIQQMG
ncbi:ribosomal protection-like ABC-F family protein [Pseudalkalibacillus decolorationis]|uniref:ribosomal protection-like ABC-F family protein n=1 Tax=Pseudalkalibacillus decolorationis TaxID=163879 RepID=UPI002147B40E|nr:ABC-F type ribosomal protection protein [Pseudalkalibacillus decolorationis]